ncbi:MAG: HEAT repeat domain-containing protein [Acidobacteria bacterium]|nr:HEAT repeat domain-containing protein [Acidobacteriota bacterium]
MTIAAVLVIPASAWAQVPVPPTPPPAPVAPAPWVVNSLELQEAMERARLAMDEQRVTMDSMKFDFDLQTTGVRAAELAREAREVALVSMGGSAYDMGISLMSRRDYERAIVRFDQVIAQKAARADAALYHKAYALYRLGRGSDATATLASLKKDFPKSAYLKDASVLEAAVRESAGQPLRPEQADDDELKLLALNALQHSDPERALPLLEGVLNGANSLQLKQRAIFVLAQSTQPRARQVLMDLAKGAGNPDLQRYAIRYVASGGRQGATTAELRAIYDSTQDADIKRAVIQALGQSGNMFTYVTAGEFTGVRPTRAAAGAKPDNAAVTQELLSIYQKEQDLDLKKAIISSLARQNSGEALVAIARKETNMTLKRDIVSRLSTMSKNKAAMDYMLEIIK